jgi:hypothetical protein
MICRPTVDNSLLQGLKEGTGELGNYIISNTTPPIMQLYQNYCIPAFNYTIINISCYEVYLKTLKDTVRNF